MEDLEDSDTEMEENDVFFQAMCFMCLAGVIFYISCEKLSPMSKIDRYYICNDSSVTIDVNNYNFVIPQNCSFRFREVMQNRYIRTMYKSYNISESINCTSPTMKHCFISISFNDWHLFHQFSYPLLICPESEGISKSPLNLTLNENDSKNDIKINPYLSYN